MIEGLASLLTAGAAVATAVAATIGVNAWLHKLRGEKRYEAARAFLDALYRYRDALKKQRDPRDFDHELQEADSATYPSIFDFDNPEDWEQARKSAEARNNRQLWRTRYEAINALKRVVWEKMFDLEVLGVKGLSPRKADIENLELALYHAISWHFRQLEEEANPTDAEIQPWMEQSLKKEAATMEQLSRGYKATRFIYERDEDAFETDLDALIKKLETIARQHM